MLIPQKHAYLQLHFARRRAQLRCRDRRDPTWGPSSLLEAVHRRQVELEQRQLYARLTHCNWKAQIADQDAFTTVISHGPCEFDPTHAY